MIIYLLISNINNNKMIPDIFISRYKKFKKIINQRKYYINDQTNCGCLIFQNVCMRGEIKKTKFLLTRNNIIFNKNSCCRGTENLIKLINVFNYKPFVNQILHILIKINYIIIYTKYYEYM